MLNKILNSAINRPNNYILLFIIFGLLGIGGLPFLNQVSDISQLISKDDKAIQLNQKMEAIFGSTRLGLITVKEGLTLKNIAHVKSLHTKLVGSEAINDVISIFSEEFLQDEGGSFDVQKLVETVPQTTKDITELKERLKTFPLYLYSLYNKNALNILVQFKSDISDQEMSSILSQSIMDSPIKDQIYLSGWPEINNSIKGIMDRDLFILVPLIFIVISIIFFKLFGSLRGVIVPLVTIGIAIAVSVGFMSLFGLSLNVVSNSIPLLLVAIGTSDGIHFMTKYYLYQKNFSDHKELLRYTGNIIGPTILLTSVTTMGGFLANLFSPVASISEFGLITAVGVFTAGAASFLLIPSLLSKFKFPKIMIKNQSSNDHIFSLLSEKMYHSIYKNLKLYLIGLILIFGISIYKVIGLEANYTLLGYFSPDTKVVKSAIQVSDEMGGLIEFNITVDTGENDGLLKPSVLKAFDDLSSQMKLKYPNDIVYITSLADFIKNMARAYNGEKSFYKIPENPDAISQYLEVYSWSGEPEEDLKYVTNENYSIGRIYGRFKLQVNEKGELKERNLRYYEKIINEIKFELKQQLPNAKIENYGELPMWITTLYNIVEGQISSVLLAVIFVFFIALPILKNLHLTLLALIPISFAISMNFAFMNLFNIQLDIATSLVSAMAIGIGIDDALHFLLTYKRLRQHNETVEETLLETMKVTGKAIISTSITLVIGYSVFFFSSFTPINNFGLLNIVTIIVATLATLIAMPVAVFLLKPLKDLK